MRRVALAGLLLLTGCGLPMTDSARTGGLQDERSRPAGIKVLPPGPQPGASAEDIVRGFLKAQSSPDDNHGVARQFLAPGTRWNDDAFTIVYTPGSQTVRTDASAPDRVELRLEPRARIEADGAYRLLPSQTTPAPAEGFVVAPVNGQLRLTRVPAGLRLQTSNVVYSFTARNVYFLGRGLQGEATGRLVADRVFLPVTVDPARALVEALLRGASGPLADAVVGATPPGTVLRGLEVTDSGQVTVDLSAQVLALSSRDRQRLSAQLVWTLQDFSGVRLLVEGRPLPVEATSAVQTVQDWEEFNPDGVADGASLYYVQDRRLRSLDRPLTTGDAASGEVAVDEAAVDLPETQVGVLTISAKGDDEVRVGPLRAGLGAPVFRRPQLGSLSWGSGDRGLFVLERGPRPLIWRLPAPVPAGRPQAASVAYRVPAGAGPLTRFEVSRDGARIAMIFGAGAGRTLFVGQLVPTSSGLVVADVVAVAPELVDVTDVAWESGTSLVVLARDADEASLLTLQVAVDGSRSAPVQRQGVEGVPQTLAAAPGRRLVVAATVAGRPPRLYRDDGSVFRSQADGSMPTYPG
ncbi:MAG: GerMN domain-containing protein [Frankiales bacterium]|nr:GerMN domain-containing protein [Frankiales bacterium]